MECNKCDSPKVVYKNSEVEIYLCEGEMEIGLDYPMVRLEISFCPFCGRRLDK